MVLSGTRQPLEGGAPQPFPSAPIDGFGGCTEPDRGSRLDLAEGDDSMSDDDHVDLAGTTAPVAGHDAVAITPVVAGGAALAPPAEGQVAGRGSGDGSPGNSGAGLGRTLGTACDGRAGALLRAAWRIRTPASP